MTGCSVAITQPIDRVPSSTVPARSSNVRTVRSVSTCAGSVALASRNVRQSSLPISIASRSRLRTVPRRRVGLVLAIVNGCSIVGRGDVVQFIPVQSVVLRSWAGAWLGGGDRRESGGFELLGASRSAGDHGVLIGTVGGAGGRVRQCARFQPDALRVGFLERVDVRLGGPVPPDRDPLRARRQDESPIAREQDELPQERGQQPIKRETLGPGLDRFARALVVLVVPPRGGEVVTLAAEQDLHQRNRTAAAELAQSFSAELDVLRGRLLRVDQLGLPAWRARPLLVALDLGRFVDLVVLGVRVVRPPHHTERGGGACRVEDLLVVVA